MEIIRKLQEETAPEVFTPRCVYDGRKNMFGIRELPFEEGSAQFDVQMGTPPSPGSLAREQRPYKVKLTLVAQINPEVLRRYLMGQQSLDNQVLTAITALNVVVRHEPTLRYPFNVRSFFTDIEHRDIGGGIVLWRGYFQSIRPAIGRMLINIDISTGMMYKPGPLISLCFDILGRPQQSNANLLAPSRGLSDRDRLKLNRAVSGAKVIITSGNGQTSRAPRAVRRLTIHGASREEFELRLENGSTRRVTVADYFQRTCNRPLRFPDVLCVEVGNGAKIPLELCVVPPGQIMRKQVPSESRPAVLAFATKKPQDRLASIQAGLGVLAYGQSDYVRQFGLHVDGTHGALQVNARILKAPTLQYGRGSRQANITPRDGKWNMIDKKFYKPVTIERWVIVVYEGRKRFGEPHARDVIKSLRLACTAVGITVLEDDPLISYAGDQPTGDNVRDQLRSAGMGCVKKHGKGPQLMIIILPEGATDLYVAVKHFGDVTQGVATQCLKSSKCLQASHQYFANVCLKINVKLGGINTIPEPRSVSILTDPHNPTIVMGADVNHPAAHSEGKPSFASLVANVDSDTAKYVADCRVQTGRVEMIADLEAMTKGMLEKWRDYRTKVERKANANPKRLIFFRDGVSEGQFDQVLKEELPRIKDACASLNMNPLITVIVVGKRHHVRFFPAQGQGDSSGNCPAGTVVDRDIVNPVEFDFYLQSHGGLLGTSRPAHYNVLYDDSKFSPDSLQALCFALCHVYARSTRSVSIPAPVYYADIVCSRAKNHYDPSMNIGDLSETNSATGTDAEAQLQVFRDNFRPLHSSMGYNMYFS
ncbi:argonaute-like protein [Phanerochaete sordida]|uniref:Argonaute-like protein n=1 Tax=Phanerochaete sordida TaxID=48140 RepID=A0A9P3FX45_9APHY|nr:argonaute-like protein [Phanerochaete sordida]